METIDQQQTEVHAQCTGLHEVVGFLLLYITVLLSLDFEILWLTRQTTNFTYSCSVTMHL